MKTTTGLGAVGVACLVFGAASLGPVGCVGSDAGGISATNDASASPNDEASTGTGSKCDGNPGAPEICGNKIDDNCDGQVDEGCDCSGVAEGATRVCGKDGPGNCKVGTQTCKEQSWTACTGVDPVAMEFLCDGKDENCDGQVDEGLTIGCARDSDGDGYTNAGDRKDACPDPAAAAAPRYGCPLGYVRETQSKGPDCNDNDPSIRPGVPEKCDGIDWDCDGKARNTCPGPTETYGAIAQFGPYGITSMVSGCGSYTYQANTVSCASGGAIGLAGYFGGAFSGPSQLQLNCSDGIINETVTTPEYTYKLGWNGAAALGTAVGTAAASSTYVAANCNTGDWVVGINYAASCLFDYMKLVCAPISYVRSGSTSSASTGTTYITNVGGQDFGRTPISKTCPAGSVMTELTTWVVSTQSVGGSNYVSGMRLGCKPLGYTPQ